MEWLIAITGLPYEVMILILLAVAGAFAGFVDSIVGGGGLISVPAMLLTNLPPSMALGSNKLSSIFGAGSASITFLRNHMVDFRLVRKLLPFTFIGSMLGTLAVVSLPPLYVKPIIIVLLVAVTLFVVFKKNWGEVNRTSQVMGRALYICMAFALGIGIYDGFYGPGTGTFLLLLLTGLAHIGLTEAAGTTKVINLSTNISALVVFLLNGVVMLPLGIVAGVFSIAGNYVGTRIFTEKGTKFVKPFILAVLVIFFIKVLTELFG